MIPISPQLLYAGHWHAAGGGLCGPRLGHLQPAPVPALPHFTPRTISRIAQRPHEKCDQEWSLKVSSLCRAKATALETGQTKANYGSRLPLVADPERAPERRQHLVLTAITTGNEWEKRLRQRIRILRHRPVRAERWWIRQQWLRRERIWRSRCWE